VPKIRVDLHVHTEHSWDSTITAAELRDGCLREGVGAVALTEHNKFGSHAEVARACPGLKVIPGEEIKTRDGELIGLFLQELVPRHLSAAETVARIKRQGGLVYLPHPFVELALERLSSPAMREVLPQVDIVEVWNARGPTGWQDRKAAALADREGKAGGAGSDCHSKWELGKGTIEMEDFEGPRDFLKKLRAGRVVGQRSNPLLMARACGVMLMHMARGGSWGI